MMVKTRFAPSPTGYLHIGGARTALYSWLHTRKHGGRFILRIEDTDQQRSTEASVNAILEGMTWLGLDYDEGPFYQTQRFDRYKEVVQQLITRGHAYRCYCSREELDQMREAQMQRKEKPRYDGRCRNLDAPKEGVDPVIRFRNPTEGEVVIHDLVKGQVVVNNAELDDLIIARSDGTPTYNLTVVIDDLDMGVSVVIRGDDHLNNTPRQINILSALEADIPAYAHLPMILGADGKRLSKRHGAVSVMQYKEDGYLPEALLNYLVRLGWSSGDQEIFSVDEMLAQFDVADVNKSASTFNAEKLLWVNHQHIMNSDAAFIANQLRPYLGKIGIDPEASDLDLVAIVSAQRERTKTLVELAQNCAFYFQDVKSYNAKAAKKAFKPEAIEVLHTVKNALENLGSWQREHIHQVFQQVVTRLDIGFGKLGMPLRLAVTGGAPSPDLDLTVWLIGKENVLSRIDNAISYIDENS